MSKKMTEQQIAGRMKEIEGEWAADLNSIPFESISHGASRAKYWWRCTTCGWEWEATPYNRIHGKTDCPACTGRVVTERNSLGINRPDLIAWWDHEKNGGVTPFDVAIQGHGKFFFKCPNGHSYKRPVYHMVSFGGCKYCAGQAATEDRNLRTTHPDLCKEWHPTLNGNLRPEDVLPGSNKKVWWRCNHGHEWQASVSKRALRGDRCPDCYHRVSMAQMRVFAELQSIFDDVRLGETVDGYELDVYLPSRRIGIEIDGYPWHSRR